MLDEMRRNIHGDWRISDIEKACRQAGVTCDAPRAGGSHYKIKHPAIERILTIPSRRPIKPVYIRMLVAFIDEVRSAR